MFRRAAISFLIAGIGLIGGVVQPARAATHHSTAQGATCDEVAGVTVELSPRWRIFQRAIRSSTEDEQHYQWACRRTSRPATRFVLINHLGRDVSDCGCTVAGISGDIVTITGVGGEHWDPWEYVDLIDLAHARLNVALSAYDQSAFLATWLPAGALFIDRYRDTGSNIKTYSAAGFQHFKSPTTDPAVSPGVGGAGPGVYLTRVADRHAVRVPIAGAARIRWQHERRYRMRVNPSTFHRNWATRPLYANDQDGISLELEPQTTRGGARGTSRAAWIVSRLKDGTGVRIGSVRTGPGARPIKILAATPGAVMIEAPFVHGRSLRPVERIRVFQTGSRKPMLDVAPDWMDTTPGTFVLTDFDLLITARADGLHVWRNLSDGARSKRYFVAANGAHDLAATADGTYYTNAAGDPHRITVYGR